MTREKKESTRQPTAWVRRLLRCIEEDGATEGGLWAEDAVAAYQLHHQSPIEKLPLDLPQSTLEKVRTFLKTLAHHVVEDLHQINAEDARLTLTEREEVLRAQRRRKAEIPEDRKRELVEYAETYEPMTDAEVRQKLIEQRIKNGLPALNEEELIQAVRAQNWDACSMWKCGDPRVKAMTIGERVVWARTHAGKGPQTREERDFVETVKRLQERQKMNILSMDVADTVGNFKKALREVEAENKAKVEAPPADTATDMLTIRQAADYAHVSERSIRSWLKRQAANGNKMLPGAVVAGRLIRIPRTDLAPWRKAAKVARTPKPASAQRSIRKSVKQET